MEFLREYSSVAPAPVSILENEKEYRRQLEALGAGTAGTVHIALGQGVPLCSDDAVLRTAVGERFAIKGAGSQAILNTLLDAEEITESEYNSAVIELVMANYRVMFINSKLLLWALRGAAFRVTPEISALLALLDSSNCDEGPAAAILAELARLVWLEPLLSTTKTLLLSSFLSTLGNGRPERVFQKFLTNINQLFRLHPTAAAEIGASTQLWLRAN